MRRQPDENSRPARSIFAQAARTYFGFLTAEYGFHCVEAEDNHVRYESDRIYVAVYHDHHVDLEVYVGILPDKRSPPGQAYELPIFLRLGGASDRLPHYPIQVGTNRPTLLRKSVEHLASLVREYARPALVGDPAIFQTLAEIDQFRREAEHRQAERWRQEEARRRADRPWHSQDYQKVVDVYTTIADVLTPMESKRLDYARRHLREGAGG